MKDGYWILGVGDDGDWECAGQEVLFFVPDHLRPETVLSTVRQFEVERVAYQEEMGRVGREMGYYDERGMPVGASVEGRHPFMVWMEDNPWPDWPSTRVEKWLTEHGATRIDSQYAVIDEGGGKWRLQNRTEDGSG